jgi:hypothetical protein
VPYELVEGIRYAPTAPWPGGADGTGLSLHRTSATSFGNEPLNWTVAAPTPGRGATVTNSLRITSVGAASGNVQLKFTAVAQTSYAIQSRAQLVIGSWASITNVTPAVSGEATVTVPVSGPMRFYQVLKTTP